MQYYASVETNGHRLYFLPVFVLFSPGRSLWGSQWLVYQSLLIRWIGCHLEVSRDHPDQTFKNIVKMFPSFDVGLQWHSRVKESCTNEEQCRKLIGKMILPKKKKKKKVQQSSCNGQCSLFLHDPFMLRPCCYLCVPVS